MNKKRALSILMAAAMAAGTLVTSVPVYADDVEEITWMFWDDLEATEDLISKGYKDVIDRFNEEYDGKYHVTPITTNLEEYDGKLNALIAAGQTPDVYICNPGPNMDVYVNAGAAADLTDILENQEADWYASFTDGIFERMTYDGKIMAVPTNFAAACVYYNTEMFADAGVEVPTTYDSEERQSRDHSKAAIPLFDPECCFPEENLGTAGQGRCSHEVKAFLQRIPFFHKRRLPCRLQRIIFVALSPARHS